MLTPTIISEEAEQQDQTKKSSGAKTFSYPSTVGSEADDRHSNYLIFNAVEAVTDSFDIRGGSLRNRRNQYLKTSQSNSKSGLKEKSLAYVQMYMPSITENLSHTYEQSKNSLISDLAGILMQSTNNGESLSGMFNSETGGEAWNLFVEKIAATGQSLANDAVVRTTGKIRGERQSGLYSGTELRQHNFSFELKPKDLNELKNVGNIVRIFQKFSAATLVSDESSEGSFNTIKVPPLWYITERQRTKDAPRYIPKFNFGPAVITSVSVNKTPDEMYTSFKNTGGDPVSVRLDLTFQELIPTYQQYWDLSHEGLS